MAKRKRLSGANPMFLDGAHATGASEGTSPPPPAHRAPIADVAADSATNAALQEVTGELTRARENGRLISRVALEQIELGYLVRDRVAVEDEDMDALMTSLRDRGQQTPIEVAVIGAGRYGLISGWRRCQALARLRDAGEGDGTVLAIQRRPERSSDAYRAMVEENEIRAGLSYFERARIVVVAVDQGVFETHKKALLTLFAAASRPKRSKIRSFIPLVQHLGKHLRFPQAIGERLGLRLSPLLEAAPEGAQALAATLDRAGPASAEAEQTLLTRWAGTQEKRAQQTPVGEVPPDPVPDPDEIAPGLCLRDGRGKLVLEGPALDVDLRARLVAWLQAELG